MKSDAVHRSRRRSLHLTLLALLLNALCGCMGTVSPDPVQAHSIAWVGDKQDAGIVRFALDDQGHRIGLVVRPAYVANYDRLVAAWGAKIDHPVKGREGIFLRPDGLYYVDAQHAAAEMEMERLDHAAHGL